MAFSCRVYCVAATYKGKVLVGGMSVGAVAGLSYGWTNMDPYHTLMAAGMGSVVGMDAITALVLLGHTRTSRKIYDWREMLMGSPSAANR